MCRPVHLLQLGVCSHAALGVALRQLKHAVVQAVEARQRHKLEFVAHGAQVLWRCNAFVSITASASDLFLAHATKNLAHALLRGAHRAS